jgi:pyrroline-5-carboxylate reductase
LACLEEKMNLNDRLPNGLLLLGCGNMGSAMLQGWLNQGLLPENVWVIDPQPSDWVRSTGVHINTDLPAQVSVALLAVKPQMMREALPKLAPLSQSDTVFLSIAAGTSIETYEEILGSASIIVRAMPNTPAAIGQGITALIGNSLSDEDALELSETLLSAIGQTVRLDRESQMDAVTGLSGSGPAYVFFLIDALAAAGRKQGLSETMAMTLAKATVAGAGALAKLSELTPEQLRLNVTSPNGTTQAGLEVLMSENNGLVPLIKETVARATERSKELSNG